MTPIFLIAILPFLTVAPCAPARAVPLAANAIEVFEVELMFDQQAYRLGICPAIRTAAPAAL
jgi:hypothetical protein